MREPADASQLLATVRHHQRFWTTLFYAAAAASTAVLLLDRAADSPLLGTLGWLLAVAAVWGAAGVCLVPVVGALSAVHAGLEAWPGTLHRMAVRGARTLSALGILSILVTGLEPRAVAAGLPLTVFAMWAAHRMRRLTPTHHDGDVSESRQTAQFLAVVAVVAIAVLGLSSATNFASTKAGAYAAAMRSDLRNLVIAQEDFFSEHGRYSRDATELDFAASQLTVGPRIWLTDDGWSATIAHEALEGTCHAFMGGTPNPPATEAGRVACRNLPPRRRSPAGGFLLFASTQVLLLGAAVGVVYPWRAPGFAPPAAEGDGVEHGDAWAALMTRAAHDHDRWSMVLYGSLIGTAGGFVLATAVASALASRLALLLFLTALLASLAISLIPAFAALGSSLHFPEVPVPPRLRRSATRGGAIATGVGLTLAAVGGRAVWWLAAPAVALGILMLRGAYRLATDEDARSPMEPRRAPQVVAGSLLLVAALALLAPSYGSSKVMAYYGTLRADMRNLVTAQEWFVADSGRYARSIVELDFKSSARVVGPTIALNPTGWTSVARHEDIPTACYVFVGTTSAGLATQEGEVACTGRPTPPKSPRIVMASIGLAPILALGLLFGFTYLPRRG